MIIFIHHKAELTWTLNGGVGSVCLFVPQLLHNAQRFPTMNFAISKDGSICEMAYVWKMHSDDEIVFGLMDKLHQTCSMEE